MNHITTKPRAVAAVILANLDRVFHVAALLFAAGILARIALLFVEIGEPGQAAASAGGAVLALVIAATLARELVSIVRAVIRSHREG